MLVSRVHDPPVLQCIIRAVESWTHFKLLPYSALQALFSQLMIRLLTGYNTATTLRTTQEPLTLGKQFESRYLLIRILGLGFRLIN